VNAVPSATAWFCLMMMNELRQC